VTTAPPPTTYPPTATLIPTGDEIVVWDRMRVYNYKLNQTATGVSVTGSVIALSGVPDFYSMFKVNFLDEEGGILGSDENKWRVGSHQTSIFELKYDTAEPAKVKGYNLVVWEVPE